MCACTFGVTCEMTPRGMMGLLVEIEEVLASVCAVLLRHLLERVDVASPEPLRITRRYYAATLAQGYCNVLRVLQILGRWVRLT